MHRDHSVIRHVALVGLTLSFAACGTGSGGPAAADAPDLEAATALRQSFPQQAAQVLQQEERFTSNTEGLALKPVQGGSWRSLELTLPHDAAGSAHLQAPGGFDVRVRELDAQGEARVTESTVSYQRAGGTSFWTAAPGGYEEWLHLSDVGAGAAIAAWEIEGAVATQLGDEVAVVDESGVPRILVSAPSAYAAGGRKVTARLKAEGATIQLFVDATGEVLVDPLWNAAQTMHNPRYGHTATLLPNGTVLVAGGKFTPNGGPDTWDSTSEVYDPTVNQWGDPKPMSVGRYAHTATLLLDGKVLLTGGMNGGGFLNVAEVYDSSSNSWAVVQPMNARHHSHTATLLGNGKVLVVGGIPENGVPEVYDPADHSFHLTGPMGAVREAHTATLLPTGKVLVAGGGSAGGFLSSTELYDPVTGPWGTWTAGPSMSTARAAHTATKLIDGRVLVAGGNGIAGAQLYDPSANSWLPPVGSMSAARSGHTATLLKSGKVLVAGGFAPNNQTYASAELFDPTTRTWTSTGSMSIVRSLHTETRLPSGSVLVTGGFGNGLQASAELYTEPVVPSTFAAPVCLSLRRGVQGYAFDAMINQEAGQTADNYGSLSLLASGVIQGTRRQSLYRWDLSLVPPGATVVSASVLFAVSSNGPGTPQVHQITAPWDEHTVSWDSFNGAFNPAAVASFNNGYPGSPAITLDVLPTAKGWVDGSIPNYGLLIEQGGPNYTHVKSSEYSSPWRRPALNLCYQAPCAPGFADCDGNGANGCETSLDSAANCGACGVTCSGESCPAACRRDLMVVVSSSLSTPLAPALAQYQADLKNEGIKAYTVAWQGGTVANLKALIAQHRSLYGIKGAWLVGDLPAAWFEGGGQTFPTDLYLMEHDGVWNDSNNNGIFDSYPNIQPELFTARLQGTTAQIQAYFGKIHQFRTTGPLVTPSAWAFIGQDWVGVASTLQSVAGPIYSQVDSLVGDNVATRDAYLNRMTGAGAEYIIQWTHADQFCLYPDGGQICANDVASNDFKGSFYWMWDCSTSRFTESQPTLAQTYLTSTSYGLATIGTTMSGGTPYEKFHANLAAGQRWGEAYLGCYGAGYNPAIDLGSLGIVVMGDPMLKPTKTAQAAIQALVTPAALSQDQLAQSKQIMLRDAATKQVGSYDEYRQHRPEFFTK